MAQVIEFKIFHVFSQNFDKKRLWAIILIRYDVSGPDFILILMYIY